MNSNKVDSLRRCNRASRSGKKFTRFSNCIGNLNHLFSGLRYIAEPASASIAGEFRKIAVLLRSARSALRSEARDLFLIAPLARTQSERRRRLALAGGFRLLRSFGIDRLDAPARRSRLG